MFLVSMSLDGIGRLRKGFWLIVALKGAQMRQKGAGV
jgi:hypothetical protein